MVSETKLHSSSPDTQFYNEILLKTMQKEIELIELTKVEA